MGGETADMCRLTQINADTFPDILRREATLCIEFEVKKAAFCVLDLYEQQF
jgi:hypothetical protein